MYFPASRVPRGNPNPGHPDGAITFATAQILPAQSATTADWTGLLSFCQQHPGLAIAGYTSRASQLFTAPLALSLSKGRPFVVRQAHRERTCLSQMENQMAPGTRGRLRLDGDGLHSTSFQLSSELLMGSWTPISLQSDSCCDRGRCCEWFPGFQLSMEWRAESRSYGRFFCSHYVFIAIKVLSPTVRG